MVLADGTLRHRQRQGERGPLLGGARRRRQLRRRHLVPVQGAPGPHRLRRPDALAARQTPPRSCAGIATSSRRRPKTLNGFFAFLTVPPGPPFPEHLHNKKMCGIVWCYTGPLEKAEQVFKPIRAFKTPALDFVGPMPHPALQSMFDALYPPGLQWYWKADFVQRAERRGDRAARQARLASCRPCSRRCTCIPINGAARRVGEQRRRRGATATRRGPRSSSASIPTRRTRRRSRTGRKDYWDALHPYSAGGAYVNFMMDEGEERIQATYGENYDRLATIKKKYDPDEPVPREPEHQAGEVDSDTDVRTSRFSLLRSCSGSRGISSRWPLEPRVEQ